MSGTPIGSSPPPPVTTPPVGTPTEPSGPPSNTDIARRAGELNLTVTVSGTDGPINLTGEQLAQLAANPTAEKLAELGIQMPAEDIGDLFRAVGSATGRGVAGARIDLSSSDATSRVYDGVANNVGADARAALIRPDGTEVSTGLGQSFDIRGDGLETRDISFGEKFLNVLLQILTRLLVFGWFAPPDTPEDKREDHIRDNATAIAAAGGSDLRAMIAPPVDPTTARGRIEELVRRANPEVDADTVTETASVIYDQLTSIYSDANMTDGSLDSLRAAVSRAGPNAFGGNPGAWLRDRMGGDNASSRFADDVMGTESGPEMQAVLALNVQGFGDAPAGEQTRMASQLQTRVSGAGTQTQAAIRTALGSGLNLDQARALNTVLGNTGFSNLSDAAQAQLIGYVTANPGNLAAIESMLANVGAMGTGNDAAFAAAMTRIDPSNAGQVTAFNGLTGSADFATAMPNVRGHLLRASDPSNLGALTALVSDANFKAFSPAQQAGVAAAIEGLDAAGRTSLMTAVQGGTFTAAQATELAAFRGANGLDAMGEAAQQVAWQAAVAGSGTVGYGAALTQLVQSADFQSLSTDTQVALLSQAKNYPNLTTVQNLRRLASAESFRDPTSRPAVSTGMTALQHQQRSAAMVAYSSAQIDLQANLPTPTTGQQQSTEILRQSLGQFLPTLNADGSATQGRFRVNWRSYTNAPGTTTYGSAANGILSLNDSIIPAGNGPVPGGAPRLAPPRTLANETNAEHVLLNTMPHEVNHLMNGDRVRRTFEYFMGEYGAWYTGYVAAFGQEPTRQQCYDRARYLLTRTTGAYSRLRDARLATNSDGTPTTGAAAINTFMAQFFVSPAPTTPAGIVPSGHTPPNPTGRSTTTRPPATQSRNMTNTGEPHGLRGSGHDVHDDEAHAHSHAEPIGGHD